ncbi:MAG: PTS fructose transporter subunit IIC [Erysipelotrichaceae bacterium]|nr:PTS fructose transporter subunit IIC [Erysipelotrichaceae bacterium]
MSKKKFNLRVHLMTGVSYMVPVIVTGGLCIGIARILGGYDVGNMTGTLGYYINQIGQASMNMIVPVLGAAIAYSMAGRPGIAPGLVAGSISVSIQAGFLGGIFGGLLAGYVVNLIIKYIKLPKTMQGLMPIIIIPVLSALVVGLIMFVLIGPPIAFVQNAILTWMGSLEGGSKALLGGIIGAMMGFDLGGPVNKTACLFANGLLAEGIYGPTAAKLVGGMIPPLGIALTVFLAKSRFNDEEYEAAKAAIPMGLCFITEGVLPFAAIDPIRVIILTVAGSSVGGALTMLWGVESQVQAGGIFIVPFMNKPLMFCFALVIGALVTGLVYFMLRPKDRSVLVKAQEETEEDIDIDIKVG